MDPLRLLVLTKYERLGSSSRVRALQFLPYLQAQGFDITVSALLPDEYVARLYSGRRTRVLDVARRYVCRVRRLLRASGFDVLWIEREALPWTPTAWELGLLSRAGVPFVVDYDDAVFHVYDAHPNAIVRRVFRQRIERIMRAAAAVIAGNPYLKQHADAAGARSVVELPSVVDLERFPESPQETPHQGRATIGWIGTPATDRFLDIVAGPLRSVCRRRDARFMCVGSKRSLPGAPTQHADWSEEGESRILSRMDVGIMPLPDTPFTRGKCGYKLIQYMAARLPVVASPVGVNRDIVKPGVNGFLAESDTEWDSALDSLVADPALRARMGAAGRRLVEQRYSTAVVAPELARVLRSAAGRARQGAGSTP